MYFLIQRISSSLIILTITIKTFRIKNFTNLIIFLSIWIKLGIFPFHFWILSTIEGIKWNTVFLILTIQKIIPITIITFFYKYNIIIFICLINLAISAIRGISIFSLRKILRFSSINHLGIIIIRIILSKKLFKIYFLTYFFLTFSATKAIKVINLNFISQTLKISKFNKLNNFILLTIFIRIAGIPPFIGFIPKIITIIFIIKRNIILATIILLILNTLSTYFYIRLSINSLLININIKKTKITKKKYIIQIYLIFRPFIILIIWNFKLRKLLIFKIKIKIN